MHAETSNGHDPFAEVKGLISDMIARLEEKASEDLYLMISMISLVSRNAESNTNHYREMLNPCKTGFDACSLQPTNGASGKHAGLLVISKYLGVKSEDQAGGRRCRRCPEYRDEYRDNCSKVVQESRLFQVEWLAEHRQ